MNGFYGHVDLLIIAFDIVWLLCCDDELLVVVLVVVVVNL